MKNNFFLIAATMLAVGCTSMDPKVDEEDKTTSSSKISANTDERKQIEDYAKSHNLKGEFTPSGLYVVIEEPGKGESPTPSSTVTMDYAGYLLNGDKFDGSKPGDPLVYSLSGLIAGWQEGVPKLKRGGKAKLIIPSKLGYGPQGSGPIPPNSVLVFDIRLIDFK